MGASTAILYAAEDPKIAGLVLDSPFSNLAAVCRDQAMAYRVRIQVFHFIIGIFLITRPCSPCLGTFFTMV